MQAGNIFKTKLENAGWMIYTVNLDNIKFQIFVQYVIFTTN